MNLPAYLVAALATLPFVPMEAQASQRIASEADFAQVVVGRDLTRLGVRLQVTPDGAITGRALGTEITGTWDWRDGYFCREMAWGDRTFEQNCQQVVVDGDKVTFTSDRGSGDSAYLNLE